jgi:hypothetical protein
MAACRLREGGVPHFSHCGALNWFAHDHTRSCADLFGCYLPEPDPLWLQQQRATRNLTTVRAVQRMLDGENEPPTALPCVAVHVRRGDACLNRDRRCFPDTKYFEAIRTLARPGDDIFLLTDSHSIDRSEWERNLSMRVRWNELNRSNFFREAANATLTVDAMRRKGLLVEQTLPKLGGHMVAELLSDVHEGRRCRAFVGTFRAGISRLVFAAMTADRAPAPVPHVSLDGSVGEVDHACYFL